MNRQDDDETNRKSGIAYAAALTLFAAVVTFCGLALTQALSGFPGTNLPLALPSMWSVFQVTAWLAVGFCVFRGLPVIVHSLREYWGVPATVRAKSATR